VPRYHDLYTTSLYPRITKGLHSPLLPTGGPKTHYLQPAALDFAVMPSVSKNGPALFLGLELATDQLRASIVDESLELVGVECVDFDSELSEYQ
jgi:hypothetical protein